MLVVALHYANAFALTIANFLPQKSVCNPTIHPWIVVTYIVLSESLFKNGIAHNYIYLTKKEVGHKG